MVDELKKRKKLADIMTIGIVTDYTLHPYWEDVPRVQYIVTASELLTYRCVQRGVPRERILPFGIPVHPKFNLRLDRRAAAEELGIDPDMHTILLMGGSMGHAEHVKTIEKIVQIGMPFQMLVVCGNNKKMQPNSIPTRRWKKRMLPASVFSVRAKSEQTPYRFIEKARVNRNIVCTLTYHSPR